MGIVPVHHVDDLADVAVALEEGPHRIPVAAIPLAPAGREAADLVTPQVPGLRDHLKLAFGCQIPDLQQQRMLLEEPPLLVPVGAFEGVRGPAQDRGQVESETVDAHHIGPVGERVDHQLLGGGDREVELVGAAGGPVDQQLLVRQHVVVAGGKTAEADKAGGVSTPGPIPALGGMVVHHVEVDLQAGVVEGLHHLFELPGRPARRAVMGVAAVRGEIGEGLISPEIRQLRVAGIGRSVGLVDRQQFDSGDSQRFQVRRQIRCAGIRAAQFVGHVDHLLEAGLV